MDGQHSDILVIGGGMAGLACATQLQAAGRDVCVLDKGRGPGGRMAARRADVAGEPVSFDHGAQYFTARDPGFQAAVAEWEAQGVVARWPAAGADAWVGTPGMNGPIRAMASDLTVHWSERAIHLRKEGEGWEVITEGSRFTADTVLIAVPAEQAAELLAQPAPDLAAVAGAVISQPCWAVMVGFAERLPIFLDALRDGEAPIAWAARNSSKPGRAGEETWVLHASPSRSRELIDLPREKVGALLLADFFVQTEAQPVIPLHCVAHRWLYAMPASIEGGPTRFDSGQRIGIAGDYLHSPRVEGAWLSGTALATAVLGEQPS